MLLPVLALVLAGFAISLPATALCVRLGRRLGALDTPGAPGHAKVLRAVPNIGGLAIFMAIVPPMAVALVAFAVVDETTWGRWIPALAKADGALLRRIAATTPTAAALLACLTVLHVIGLIDDRRGLSPWPKLLAQSAAAAVLAIWFDVRLFTFLGPAVSVIVTVLWVVAITNAMNFIDNMDGLCAGVSGIAGALFMAAALITQQWFIAGTLALLVGALAGFLVFNFPPARIFMGDGGSLVIGFLLAVLSVRTTFYDPSPEDPVGAGPYAVLMPLVVLAIPLYDLCTVSAIRLRQGRSPFVGDQQHFSHRLVQRGLSRRGAVIVIWSATLVSGIGGVSLGALAPWQALLVGVQTAAVLLMLAVYEHASRHAVRERAGGDQAP